MNDEIKEIKMGMYSTDEILEFMTNGEGRGFMGRSMYDAIIDYITNLQEENESLKQRIEFKNTFNNFANNKYKSRCEKAIEFIEKRRVKATPFFKQFDGDLIMPKREVDKLLSILNGGNE